MERHLPEVQAYADDTQLYIAFKPEPEHATNAVTAMQACITDIQKWMLMDKMMLNDEKTQFIVIRTGQQFVKVDIDSLCVGHTAILPSSKVRNLGGCFDNQLKMVMQTNQTFKAAFFHIFNITRIRKFLSSDTVQTLVNAFVTSQLDYRNRILIGLPNTELQKLQKVQNTAARLICHIKKFDHNTPTLVKLHWLPVRYCINFKILLIMVLHRIS